MQENENTPPSLEELIADPSFVNYCLEANEADRLFWQESLQQNPSFQPRFEDARKLIILFKDSPSDTEITSARHRLFHSLGFDKEITKKRKIFPLYRWAAAAAIVVFIGLMSVYVTRQMREKPIAVVGQSQIRQTVPAGKIMHIRLLDGTVVDLSAGSTLTYPTTFTDSSRIVTLEGDARFFVTHIDDKPFVVRTADLDIHVLGTTFNVQSFQTDRHVRVVLFEGSVQVNKNNRSYRISPGQALIYDKKNGSFAMSAFNPDEENERINGTLIFDHASYAEVGQRLAHKYGIEFIPDNRIDIAFSGKISNESIDEVLKKLNFTTNYHFYLESNTLIAKQK
ncbi:FecR family protein [Sphingobacterium suaedae]|uniref:FecR family protein n=1 Tax=Sphingobacterium suaedae TaxID=1686402 RepID=A0ABW5KLI0_9SPHI